MPKSSSARPMPRPRSAPSMAATCGPSASGRLSVSSSSSRSGARPLSARAEVHLRGQHAGGELPGGELTETRPSSGMARGIRRRPAQRPATERHDQVGAFGDRDEGRGRDRAARRVVPAQQGLRPGAAPVGQADAGLVVQRQLAAADGAAQVGGQPAAQGAVEQAGRDGHRARHDRHVGVLASCPSSVQRQ